MKFSTLEIFHLYGRWSNSRPCKEKLELFLIIVKTAESAMSPTQLSAYSNNGWVGLIAYKVGIAVVKEPALTLLLQVP